VVDGAAAAGSALVGSGTESMSHEGTQPPVSPGLTIGHYAILSSLGKGGMGEVFLAKDTRLDRRVAVKVLPDEFATDSTRRKRFEVEAKALASLNHPNIVSIFSVDECDGRLLLVMELVEGKTLRELMGPAGMTASQFLDIAVSLADAVGAAHARGVMHRDLKPENIMVTTSGWVKILDFGLAKFRSGETPLSEADTRLNTGLTISGMALGTVPYMSPEQADGDAVDHRSDIFSLGAVFHEMLTGNQPFRGRTVAQLLSAILRDDPPPLTSIRTDLPAELDAILRRCLRKRPAERYESAGDLHASLKQLRRQVESGSATPGDGVIPAGSWALLDSRWGLSALLAGLWIVNWVETNAEELWSERRGSWIGYDFAAAFSWFEQGLSFERHDLAGPVAVYLGSIAYFFLPALLLALTLVALLRRRHIDGFRMLVFAITGCYALSLPFYLFLPIPERWAYPDSQAILLSDLWSARLIELIRPISGLDNCFPSFHVSGTMALVLVSYRLGLRYRHAVAWLGAAVVLSTLLLGIHWVADIVAGLALAVVSVRLAEWMNARVLKARQAQPAPIPNSA
jgi:serine/threonine protein kinase